MRVLYSSKTNVVVGTWSELEYSYVILSQRASSSSLRAQNGLFCFYFLESCPWLGRDSNPQSLISTTKPLQYVHHRGHSTNILYQYYRYSEQILECLSSLKNEITINESIMGRYCIDHDTFKCVVVYIPYCWWKVACFSLDLPGKRILILVTTFKYLLLNPHHELYRQHVWFSKQKRTKALYCILMLTQGFLNKTRIWHGKGNISDLGTVPWKWEKKSSRSLHGGIL